MPSIVNPWVERNGASTVTRGLIRLLAMPPLEIAVNVVPACERPIRWRRAMQVRSLAGSSLGGLPAKAGFFRSRDFRRRIQEQIRTGRYDLAIVNGSDLLWIADELPVSMPRVLIAHNLEHRLFREQIASLPCSLQVVHGLLRCDCERLEKFEWIGIKQIRNIVFLSRSEAAQAAVQCPEIRSITIPPVFDSGRSAERARIPGPALELGMVGDFEWWPNRHGLQWFTQQVLPAVQSPVRLHLFGRAPGSLEGADKRIVRHGPVDDLGEAWARCDLMICPARVSAGVSVKLAEAVFHSLPVLATCAAGDALGLHPAGAIVLLDGAPAWADFLNSDAAREVAAKAPSGDARDGFSVARWKDILQDFIRQTLTLEGHGERALVAPASSLYDMQL